MFNLNDLWDLINFADHIAEKIEQQKMKIS